MSPTRNSAHATVPRVRDYFLRIVHRQMEKVEHQMPGLQKEIQGIGEDQPASGKLHEQDEVPVSLWEGDRL